MTRFIPGWIRQLTERPPVPQPTIPADDGHSFRVKGAITGRIVTGGYGKQMNVRIQSAAADIVTKLIAADIIHSQRWDQVDEIIRDVLFDCFAPEVKR